MSQYQVQEQQRVKLKPLKLKQRNGSCLIGAIGLIGAIAAGITLYKPMPQRVPSARELPQPMPSPVASDLPGTGTADKVVTPPLISVQPIEEPSQVFPDISRLMKVTAKPVQGKPKSITHNEQPKPQTTSFLVVRTSPTPVNQPGTNPTSISANQLGVSTTPTRANQLTTNPTPTPTTAKRVGIVTATSVAAPTMFVVVAAPAVANPVSPSSLGSTHLGKAVGGFAKTALAKITTPQPRLGNGGGNSSSIPPSGGNGGSGNGNDSGDGNIGGNPPGVRVEQATGGGGCTPCGCR